MLLYLKLWIPGGMTVGLKEGPSEKIRHIARLYPDRGVEVIDTDAKKLIKKYPDRVGEWEKDEKKAMAFAAKMRKKEDEERRKLYGRGPVQHHVARMPAVGKAPAQAPVEIPTHPDAEIDIEEESAPVLPESEGPPPGDIPPADHLKNKKADTEE